MRSTDQRIIIGKLAPLFTASLLASLSIGSDAADEPAAESPARTYGLRVVVSGAVSANVDRDLRNTVRELQKRAEQEGRRTVLVLEIHAGSSRFGQIHELARFLRSPDLSRIRTVAWIPENERVDGYQAVLALACNEIIMHPDAELGDIGSGRAVPADLQKIVLGIVEKRHNRKLNAALVKGMMDPRIGVLKLKVKSGKPPDEVTETRLVTPAEYQKLVDAQAIIPERKDVKPGGEIGLFSGSRANDEDFLVARTAQSLSELAAIYNVPTKTLSKTGPAVTNLKVALIEIEGMIEPVMESFLERQIDRAVDSGVNLIIFRINSLGGYLIESERLAIRIADLGKRDPPIKTAAYVPHEAISGAAMIALGCDEIYMHPTAQIGDAGSIGVGQGQQFERAPEKLLSKLRTTLRTLAEVKNRPPALLEAMADKDLAVHRVTHRDNPRRVWYMTENEIAEAGGAWKKAGEVHEARSDNLLTVNGKRAHELGLAERPIENLDELKAELGIPADMKLRALGRTWVDKLIFLLNRSEAMYVLLVIAISCVYMEMHMPSGLFGIVAAVCFGLFFWSRVLGGTAGWLEVVLFVLGLACIALEVFVIPGFGVFGISGGILLLASLILASQTFGNLDPNRDMEALSGTLGSLAASIVSVVVLAIALSRFLPRIPLFNQMILAPPTGSDVATQAGPRLRPEAIDPAMALVGRHGVTLSVLRPAGKANIDGRLLDVVSEGPYIERGATIEVLDVAGNRIVVRESSTA